MPTRIYNSTLIYDVILVVVLGGIGLSGGRGGVVNVIIGTLLIGTMLNGDDDPRRLLRRPEPDQGRRSC